jgi:hypothetical protein
MAIEEDIDLTAINPVVENWSARLKSRLRNGLKNGSDISVISKKRDGIIEKSGVKFQRFRVFKEKGAGKGYGGKKGSTWLTSKGESRRTKQESLGRMGTGKRSAQPWINPILKEEVPKLSAELAEVTARVAVNHVKALFIK